ncbi:MAG TPA: hypothetical protein VHA33_10300 [Candidatus Angelobacter sp.]|jgi:hypothetical protein|nr:hypothetical protein [Candidatus Angelobacter sp.]
MSDRNERILARAFDVGRDDPQVELRKPVDELIDDITLEVGSDDIVLAALANCHLIPATLLVLTKTRVLVCIRDVEAIDIENIIEVTPSFGGFHMEYRGRHYKESKTYKTLDGRASSDFADAIKRMIDDIRS